MINVRALGTILILISVTLALPSKGVGEIGNCQKDSGARLAKARELLNEGKIRFDSFSDGSLRITPQKGGPFLNSFAREVDEMYGAKVVVSPDTFICEASAISDPQNICDLKINLGWQALSSPDILDTFPHESKHLELAGPSTNAGYDSLFFGRISNLDKTDKSFYPSFALDEIAAYGISIPWLFDHRGQMAEGVLGAQLGRDVANLMNLVPRAEKVIKAYREFLEDVRSGRGGYSAFNSQGNIAIAEPIENSKKPAIVLSRGDWRNAGSTNIVTFVDGHNQLTIPLFDSKISVVGSANAMKGTTNPSPEVKKEMARVSDRFDKMLTAFGEIRAITDQIYNAMLKQPVDNKLLLDKSKALGAAIGRAARSSPLDFPKPNCSRGIDQNGTNPGPAAPLVK